VSAEANLIPSPGLQSAPCAHCGAPGASDQRYCLECGVRRGESRSRFLGGLQGSQDSAAGMPDAPGPPNAASGGRSRKDGHSAGSSWTTVIAGVGVLLLALGIGVLIGRSGTATTVSTPAEVVSVSSGTPGAAGVAGSSSTAAPALKPTQVEGSAAAAAGKSAKKGSQGTAHKPGSTGSASPPAGSSSSKTPSSSPSGGQSNEQKSRNMPDVVSTG
jgi:hypothetical protein